MKLFSIVALSTLLVPSLAEAAVSTFAVVMTSQQEVPTSGAPNTSTATGSATLAFDDVTKRLTGTLTYAGLSGPAVAAHVHEAPCGASGSTGGASLGVAATSPIAIDVVLGSEQEAALGRNGLYLDLHTLAYPDGEIRGQLLSAGAPMCTGSRPAGADQLGVHIDAADAAASDVDASCPSTTARSDAGAAAAASATQGGDVGCSAGGSTPGAGWVVAGALVLAARVRRRRPSPGRPTSA